MQTFNDSTGQEWQLEVNGFTIKKVRTETDIVLTDLADLRGGEESVFVQLFSPPYVDLVAVLWSLCEEQADVLDISPNKFASHLGGVSLGDAAKALSRAVPEMFPDASQRKAIAAAMDALWDASEAIAKGAADQIAD